jgi:23S rRNA (adenine2503-C2)-methyltransferase
MVAILDRQPLPIAGQLGTPVKPSLAGLDRAGLRAALLAIGVPEKQVRMRVGQLWSWIYVRGVTSFDAMSDVAKDLRRQLDDAKEKAGRLKCGAPRS